MNDPERAGTEKKEDWLEGDSRVRKGIQALFLKNVPGQMKKLEEALINGDRPAAELLAHSVKGAAAMIGALALRDAAHTMEEACGRGDMDAAALALKNVEPEFRKVIGELQRQAV